MTAPNTKIEEIIKERDGTHGKYSTTARIHGELKILVVGVPNSYTAEQAHSLDMILVKIARIVSGNPNFEEHWRDVEGYAKLAADAILAQKASELEKHAQAQQGSNCR